VTCLDPYVCLDPFFPDPTFAPVPSIMPETTSHTTAADEASPAPPLFMSSVDLTVLSPVQRGFVQSIRALDV